MAQSAFKSNMVLFIPRVFPDHANQDYMSQEFYRQGLGAVDHVDFVEKHSPDGQHFFEAFVHFSTWFNTPQSILLQSQIQDPYVKAQVFHAQREVAPGVWRPAFWIVNECFNPETPLERDLKTQLFDERAQTDWEVEELRSVVSKQEHLIAHLMEQLERQSAMLGEQPDPFSFVTDFDPLLLTPDSQDDLPPTGHELASSIPDGPLSDFYQEQTCLSPEWLSLSNTAKRFELDEELDEMEYSRWTIDVLRNLATDVAGKALPSRSDSTDDDIQSYIMSETDNEAETTAWSDAAP